MAGVDSGWDYGSGIWSRILGGEIVVAYIVSFGVPFISDKDEVFNTEYRYYLNQTILLLLRSGFDIYYQSAQARHSNLNQRKSW